MRGFLAGTVGEYYSHTGYSVRVFKLFGSDASNFEGIVQSHSTDEAVLGALLAAHVPDAKEIAELNLVLSGWPNGDPGGVAFVHEFKAKHGLTDRTDAVTGFNMLDLDEGRQAPRSGRAPSDTAKS